MQSNTVMTEEPYISLSLLHQGNRAARLRGKFVEPRFKEFECWQAYQKWNEFVSRIQPAREAQQLALIAKGCAEADGHRITNVSKSKQIG